VCPHNLVAISSLAWQLDTFPGQPDCTNTRVVAELPRERLKLCTFNPEPSTRARERVKDPAWRQLCPTTSIWTVDLAYLLRLFGADVTFCTITLGANPDFAAESFYRDNLNEAGLTQRPMTVGS
jgi:hypothetical protein